MRNYLIIGAGAAGTFAAANLAQLDKTAKVVLAEKTRKALSKVRISGGGRCNVTTSEENPQRLVLNYPRGHRELLGPFHRFGPKEMVQWLEERGVRLKTEADGRMFPVTDSSQTIIDALMGEALKNGVQVEYEARFDTLPLDEYDAVLLATGSSSQGHRLAESVGHTITPLAPSLFTFNVPDPALHALAGTTLRARLTLPELNLSETGPLLITHWGFSGPAALKLSAWGAEKLHALNYRTKLVVDWAPEETSGLTKRLKRYLAERGESALHADEYTIEGRTTNKDEFVTCGGVELKEVDMRTMRSKIVPNLYFAGEVLNIDAVTGGFNFQAAWTTAWHAAHAMSTQP